LIYNIYAYFKDCFPGEKIFVNMKDFTENIQSIPERYIMITETGATETPWFQFEEFPFQLFFQDIDAPKCRKLAHEFHDAINNKFGLILPSVVVDGVTYLEVVTAQISVITKPQSLGYGENGFAQFSSNYNIKRKG